MDFWFNKEKLTKMQANELGSITLAFIGDAVYSLYVRTKNSLGTSLKSGKLNELTSNKVCATSQAKTVDLIISHFTEEELAVFKRARNTKKPSKSKHSSVSEYNKSTGFEAVIGYLYLIGDSERLQYILEFGDNINEG